MKRDESGRFRAHALHNGKMEDGLLRWAVFFVLFGLLATPAFAQELVIDVNVFGLNQNERTASTQLTDSCDALGNQTAAAVQDLQATCAIIEQLDPNDPDDAAILQPILEAAAPEEAFTADDAIVYVSDFQTSNVLARIGALRAPGFRSAAAANASRGGGAATGFDPRLGVFFNASLTNGDIDGEILEQDSDTSGNQFTLGADYRINDQLLVGAGVGAISNDSDFRRVRGGSMVSGLNLTAFTSWLISDNAYVDGVLDIGVNSYDLNRDIGVGTADVRALSSTDSSSTALTIGAGRSFAMREWSGGGYFRYSITRGEVDGYTERASVQGAGFGSVFSIGSQSVDSSKITVGVEASRVISTARAVVIPLARLELEWEGEDNKEPLSATLVASGLTRIYDGTKRDSSYGTLALGASAVLPRGISGFAFFESRFAHDFVNQYWLKLGIRAEL